jgi:hypothetical protein
MKRCNGKGAGCRDAGSPGQAIGLETIAELHDRIVALVQMQGAMIADNLISIGRYTDTSEREYLREAAQRLL